MTIVKRNKAEKDGVMNIGVGSRKGSCAKGYRARKYILRNWIRGVDHC